MVQPREEMVLREEPVMPILHRHIYGKSELLVVAAVVAGQFLSAVLARLVIIAVAAAAGSVQTEGVLRVPLLPGVRLF